MGAVRLAAVCAKLEAAGRSGELDDVDAQLHRLETELKQATEALQASLVAGQRAP
jgi:HPt (histidine-containing phosphotransfer) domain-containing protein